MRTLKKMWDVKEVATEKTVNPVSKGFTLIELLIVIAIITLLAAILFPVFARARENARRASCQSNLKQIALGIKMYTQDYDEKMPKRVVADSLYDVANPGHPYGWADALQPYLKSTQIFQCPSEGHKPESNPATLGYSDYWLNILADGAAESAFDYTAQTVLVGEGGYSSMDIYKFSKAAYGMTGCGTLGGSTCAATDAEKYASFPEGSTSNSVVRHLDGMNVSFVDGHVKWFKGNASTNTSAAIWNAATGPDKHSPTFKISSGNLE